MIISPATTVLSTEALSIPEDSLGCVLRNFIVRPDVRRQGLGTELARGCIETARGIMAENSGVAACVLQVSTVLQHGSNEVLPAPSAGSDAGSEAAGFLIACWI